MDSLADIYLLAASRSEKVSGEDLEKVLAENEGLGHSLHLNSINALQTMKGEEMGGTRYASIFPNGIAVVDLIGPIFPRANMMTMSGATSIARFTEDFATAEAHADVKGVVIHIDSPGGDVRGIGDAARVVNAIARQSNKPIKAFISGIGASAAYYIAAAVGKDNIIASEMALAGSIGVILTASKNDKNEVNIISSQSPYKRPDPTDEKGKAVLQQRVDDLAEIFVRDVAKYRGISEETVLSDYGQGGVFVGPRALKQGLIDRIGTLSEVVDEMASGSTGRTRTEASDSTSVESLLMFNKEDSTMSLKDMIARFRASDESLTTDATGEQGPDATAEGANSDDTPAVAEQAPVAPQTPVAPEGTAAVSADLEAAAQAQRPTREELEERFSDGAELFATQMVTGNKVFPAHAAFAASDILNARIDDALVGGTVKFVDESGQLSEGTREAAVRSRYQAMPTHNLTQQAIAGVKAGSVAASVLSETDKTGAKEDEPVDPERRKALLASSSLGQSVLKEKA